MKKLIAATLVVCMLSICSSTNAANVSIGNYTVSDVSIPHTVSIEITPDGEERLTNMNISFSVGSPENSIPILQTNEEFNNTVWGANYFGVAQTPTVYSVLSAVTTLDINGIIPEGDIVHYTLDLSDLTKGEYTLNPNHEMGTAANVPLTFTGGSLTIVPEPVTLSLLLLTIISVFFFTRKRVLNV